MKQKLYFTAILILAYSQNIFAQAPQLMSFQSVVRNSSGTLVANHSVGLRLSILQGSISGTAVYVETKTATSNANGLVTLQIGGGTVVLGTFSAIDWSAGPYYIKSELDLTGGTSYSIAGTTQLLSVAYALYANTSGNATTASNVTQGVKIGFSSSTTWICPTGITQITVELWGGAGAGGWYYYLPGGTVHFGGNGGNGGYTKSTVNVIPGTIYNVNVGTGGQLSTPYVSRYSGTYCAGTTLAAGGPPGGDGLKSNFNNLIFADGGTGGQSAIASGNGLDGVNGGIVNYTYSSTNYGTRSYIPSNYLIPIPSSYSKGGNGHGIPCDTPTEAGEDGYCVISY